MWVNVTAEFFGDRTGDQAVVNGVLTWSQGGQQYEVSGLIMLQRRVEVGSTHKFRMHYEGIGKDYTGTGNRLSNHINLPSNNAWNVDRPAPAFTNNGESGRRYCLIQRIEFTPNNNVGAGIMFVQLAMPLTRTNASNATLMASAIVYADQCHREIYDEPQL